MPHADGYIPAMGRSSRLDLYDPLVRLTVRERRFKRRLLDQAALKPGDRVLDVGCGTGTLVVMAKHRQPRATIVGIDGDSEALSIARRKISAQAADVTLHLGLAQQLPYPAGCFDRVLSTLVLHHLTPQAKAASLQEIARVLASRGEFHFADFGPPANLLMRAGFSLIRKLDGIETTEDNFRGRLPEILGRAGFRQVRETASFSTLVGTIRLYAAALGAE